jgi:hypothetical protein
MSSLLIYNNVECNNLECNNVCTQHVGDNADDMRLIPSSRLQELEDIEKNLPMLIESALKEYKTSALKRLHEKDKENPTAVNIRVKRYAEKNRETINAKRREKRKQTTVPPPSSPTSSSLVTKTSMSAPPTLNSSPIILPQQSHHTNPPRLNLSPPKREVPVGGITIRFTD